MALLSKELGTINLNVPIDETIDDLSKKDWDNQAVYNKFKELKFNRYIERFNLNELGLSDSNTRNEEIKSLKDLLNIEEINNNSNEDNKKLQEVINDIKASKKLIYFLDKENDNETENVIKKKITYIGIINNNTAYYISKEYINDLKELFEDKDIKKIGYKLKEDYCILRDLDINMNNLYFDVEIASYLLDPIASKYEIENLAQTYLNINLDDYLTSLGISKNENKQINLFDNVDDDNKQDSKKYEIGFMLYVIKELENILTKKLEHQNGIKLFNDIEMPLAYVLAKMQMVGMHVDKEELINFGNELKEGIEDLTNKIYELSGEEFNINSTQQLGIILFEKLGLTTSKKTKKGYSTDVDSLEKIKWEHPIVDKILEYRSLMKLNSTYVEGMLPYINERTKRIHSYFHQTVTATGRISSTEPNLQNIPTRFELGKKLRKVFKPKEGYVFIDADYSQV